MTEYLWIAVLRFGEHSLYVWGSYLVALALVLMEVALIVIRGKSILGHLGWNRGFRQPLTTRDTGSNDRRTPADLPSEDPQPEI